MSLEAPDLTNLTWYEIIALAIFMSPTKAMRNSDIRCSSIVDDYLQLKKNNSLSRTISKTLNTHSVEGVSADMQRLKPILFYKDEDGKWLLNDEGYLISSKLYNLL